MIHLNIIPEIQKKEIKLKQLYDLLKNFLSVIFIALIFFACIFLILKLILSNYFVTTIAETNFLSKNTENFSRQVSDINSQIDSMKIIQKDFIYWTKILEFLRTTQGQELSLDRISIDKEKKIISIAGLSQTRDALILFKEKLEKSDFFNPIDLPISNLLKKDDITFDLNLVLKTYDFK